MLQRLYRKSASCVVMLALACYCQANSPVADGTELPKSHGYVVLNLDVDGVAPSLTIVKVLRGRSRTEQRTVSLGKAKDKLKLFNLSAGRYQITEVNAPYFDLPYRLNTENDPAWQFTIDSGKTNYLGKLVISKERSTRTVDIQLLNRIARDLPGIREEFVDILQLYPLVLNPGYRDDFLNELNMPENDGN